MNNKIIIACFIYLSVFILLSCTGNKKIVKSRNSEKAKIEYNLDTSSFPRQELVLKDTNFIAYLNLNSLSKVLELEKFIDVLRKKYFLKNAKKIYFTVSDIYKSQEFLIFLNNFNFNVKENELGKEFIANREIIKTIKTDNQEFGYVNFEKGAVYGDTAFIKELYSIYKKKLTPISDERYALITDSGFSSNKSDIKLLFMPNTEYIKILLEFVKKQPLLKPLVDGLKYLLLDVDILDDGNMNLEFVINSTSKNINLIYNFISTQKKLLMTLNGSPFSQVSSKDLIENIDLFKNLEIKKVNENKLIIYLKLFKKDTSLYLKLLKKYTK